MSIADLTFRLMKDKALQRQMLANPRAALEFAQGEFTAEEVAVLCSMPWDALLSGLAPSDPIDLGPGWWLCEPSRSTQPT